MNRIGAHQRVTSWIIITVFIAVLFVPLGISIVQSDRTYSETEKRKLAPFPQATSLGALTTFPRHFDTYYQDHFGLREWLIHRYHREMGKRFGLSGVPYVIEGNGGWLFFAGDGLLDDLRGQLQFTDEELQRFRQNILAKRAWLARRNIQYIPLVAANKQSIYGEHLPDYYRLASKQTRLDRLLETCNRDGDTVILDLRSALIDSKVKGRLYGRTDTHWNYLGAHVAYLDIMEKVKKHFPAFSNRRQFAFEAVWKEYVGGDLAVMLGKKDLLWETKPALMHKEFNARKTPLPEGLRGLLSLKQFTPEFTEHDGSRLRVLVLHDSFFNHLKPFVSENFNQTLYIWQFYDKRTIEVFSRKELEHVLSVFQPDLVIEEVVERRLDRLLRSLDQDWSD